MNCSCHGEPAYWQTDKRLAAGGRLKCAVKERERQRRLYHETGYREAKLAQMRQRYDSDPLYRLPKLMQTAARKRAATLSRRRAELRGEVQIEGRNRPSLEPNP